MTNQFKKMHECGRLYIAVCLILRHHGLSLIMFYMPSFKIYFILSSILPYRLF